MDIVFLEPREVPLALGALAGIAAANGSITPAERQLFAVIAELHGASIDVDAVTPIAPAAVASIMTDPHRRKRLVQLALVTAMVDGEVAPAQETAVKELASALDVSERGLQVLHYIVRGSSTFIRLDMMRRIMSRFLDAAYEEEGAAGVRKMLMPFWNGGEDPQVAWRYKQLGLLPEGTLGRAFWEHCIKRRLGFPGERGGIPERVVFHDFGHVLAGYDTDPQGEIQQGAFQAGFMRTDGFGFLLFVVVHFHIGIKITPIAEPQKGLFDVGRVLRAAARGAACKVDLSDHWNHWEVIDLPIEEVRARYGIA